MAPDPPPPCKFESHENVHLLKVVLQKKKCQSFCWLTLTNTALIFNFKRAFIWNWTCVYFKKVPFPLVLFQDMQKSSPNHLSCLHPTTDLWVCWTHRFVFRLKGWGCFRRPSKLVFTERKKRNGPQFKPLVHLARG